MHELMSRLAEMNGARRTNLTGATCNIGLRRETAFASRLFRSASAGHRTDQAASRLLGDSNREPPKLTRCRKLEIRQDRRLIYGSACTDDQATSVLPKLSWR